MDKDKYYKNFIFPGAKVWWNDPDSIASGWYFVGWVNDDDEPWDDETEVWMKINKTDKKAKISALLGEVSPVNK